MLRMLEMLEMQRMLETLGMLGMLGMLRGQTAFLWARSELHLTDSPDRHQLLRLRCV